ncbi:MAG: peptidase domain-containing ABC transporter [Chitinophagales bacterium]
MAKFPFYKQLDAMDCGPTCLRMIAKHYGKHYSLQHLRERSHIDREGVSLLGISDAAENVGFHTLAVTLPFDVLQDKAPLPCIAHWKQNHFVVVHKVTKDKVFVADPGLGLVSYSIEDFLKGWISNRQNGQTEGVVLLLEPTPDFFEAEGQEIDKKSFGFLFSYFTKYKKLIVQLLLCLFIGSMLQLIFPFLTQSIVDIGVNTQDMNFVYLILMAQLMLFVGRMSVEFIRSWILLHISTRVNISLISDFLVKLMRLPIAFFDTKMTGDLLQRIWDHHRIENFLTNSSFNTLFGVVNLLVFSLVLGFYSSTILLVFFGGSMLHILWILLFLKKRRELNFREFDQASANQSALIQLVQGMQEIKLNNYEKQKRWEWEGIQASLFKIKVNSLAVEQYQQAGGMFFNELKNILVTFISAQEVINGNMTLGMMMAVSYIIGQLNSPILQIIGFIQLAQDAKISLERLGEIHLQADEETSEKPKLAMLPENRDLVLDNLTFHYGGPHSPRVLDNINLFIPEGKITALVGTSGSGKTTILKLLLKFYEPTEGKVRMGELDMEHLSNPLWRSKCGVVMQEGFIFSDTIARNIAVSDEIIDKRKLLMAVKVANIQSFVESLPLSYNTKIGQEGVGLSQGQKQRLLIARAVYKNPDYLFFDEATNALDANNERIIMENLNQFFKGRTVVVVAHRLSTVQNADQIVVLEKGKIVEIGNHQTLTAKKGAYFHLVKNQLELGN